MSVLWSDVAGKSSRLTQQRSELNQIKSCKVSKDMCNMLNKNFRSKQTIRKATLAKKLVKLYKTKNHNGILNHLCQSNETVDACWHEYYHRWRFVKYNRIIFSYLIHMNLEMMPKFLKTIAKLSSQRH